MSETTPRIAIVTGANAGIGYEIAAGLAEAGLLVVMACRNVTKAEAARSAIKRRVSGASLEVLEVDLGDFGSVRRFAEAFRKHHSTLDLLVNNAGILTYALKRNPDGIELQFATNHLGHFLLTALLIELMPDDPESRIVPMASVAHKGAHIHFDDLTCGGDGGAAYGQSKLACLMFADELDRRLRAAGSRIKALAVHPGGSDSGLFDEMNRLQYLVLKGLSPFITHSNASAARPALHAALSASVEGGAYFGPQGFMELRGPVGPAKRAACAQDTGAAGRLWALSEELTGQEFVIPTNRRSAA